MKIEFLRQFRRDLDKLNPKQLDQVSERIELFKRQPNNPTLRNHGLQGRMKGRYSINITGDIRAIYRILRNRKTDDVIQFIRIGTHSQLY